MIEVHYICDCCKKSTILVAQENAVNIRYTDHKVKYLVDNEFGHLDYRDKMADEQSCRVVSAVPYVKVRLCKTCSEKFDQYMLDEGRDKSRFNVYNLWTEFYNEQGHR